MLSYHEKINPKGIFLLTIAYLLLHGMVNRI
jgi:hypothetical protein